jgi:hypothetical protein
MPGIDTSSDLYQNRNPAMTTYRKNVTGPTLADEMASRSEEKTKAAQVAARQEPASVPAKDRPATARPLSQGNQAPAQRAASIPGPGSAPVARAAADPVTPPKVVHELYAPPSRGKREHDDRHSMITGGTIDMRA